MNKVAEIILNLAVTGWIVFVIIAIIAVLQT